MSIRVLAAASLAALVSARAVAAANAGATDAQHRYDQARQLMQQSRYEEAALVYREVADLDEAPVDLRAQALFSCALMLQNARRYEGAAEAYRDVARRFPKTQFARRAELMVGVLEEGGPGRWLDFRRRQDAASDEMLAAQALAEHSGVRAARPGFERAAAILADLLRDFADHPQVPSIAVGLGNAHMAMREFAAARDDYGRAVALARSQHGDEVRPASVVDSIATDAALRREEAVRSLRRQRITDLARALLAAIAFGVVALRPWRSIDASLLRLAGGFALAPLALAVLAAAASYAIRVYVEPESPVDVVPAALLVALPGLVGEIVALSLVAALRARSTWQPGSAAGIAAPVAALAALSVATCLIDAFALFPVLDSLL